MLVAVVLASVVVVVDSWFFWLDVVDLRVNTQISMWNNITGAILFLASFQALFDFFFGGGGSWIILLLLFLKFYILSDNNDRSCGIFLPLTLFGSLFRLLLFGCGWGREVITGGLRCGLVLRTECVEDAWNRRPSHASIWAVHFYTDRQRFHNPDQRYQFTLNGSFTLRDYLHVNVCDCYGFLEH